MQQTHVLVTVAVLRRARRERHALFVHVRSHKTHQGEGSTGREMLARRETLARMLFYFNQVIQRINSSTDHSRSSLELLSLLFSLSSAPSRCCTASVATNFPTCLPRVHQAISSVINVTSAANNIIFSPQKRRPHGPCRFDLNL